MNEFEKQLVGHLDSLLSTVRKLVSDPDLSAEVFQRSMLKTLQKQDQLRDHDALVPWFRRILQTTLMDIYRERKSQLANEADHLKDVQRPPTSPSLSTACQCIYLLLPLMKSVEAEIIEELELSNRKPSDYASKLGITRNNLKVRRHRARIALKRLLEDTCKSCAKHGCLDCTCGKDVAEK